MVMRAYGHKKKRPRGDGCFLCTQDRKQTKTVSRRKAKLEISKCVEKATK